MSKLLGAFTVAIILLDLSGASAAPRGAIYIKPRPNIAVHTAYNSKTSTTLQVMNDAALRQRLQSDPVFKAQSDEFDSGVMNSTNQQAVDVKAVLHALGLQRPSQLNTNNVFYLNKKTNAVTQYSRASLSVAMSKLENQPVFVAPATSGPPYSTYGGAYTTSPITDEQGAGHASPNSYLTAIGEEYWLSPIPQFSDTYIEGHSWVGAVCAPDYIFGIIPVGGCAVAQGGVFFTPRFGTQAAYQGDTIGWTYAANQQDQQVLNVGAGFYHYDAINEWFSTDGGIIQAVYAGVLLF